LRLPIANLFKFHESSFQLIGNWQSAIGNPFIPCAALTTDCSESTSERLSDSAELQTPMV